MLLVPASADPLFRRRMTLSSTVWMAVIGVVVVGHFARAPLWPTDLWDHVNYGRYIWQTGTIPSTEPLLPAAAGTRFVATAWLSQVLMAGVADAAWLGLAGLQFCYAMLVAVALASVVANVFSSRRRYLAAGLAGAAFLAVNWEQLKIIRPQLIGVSCFCWLWLQLSARRLTRPQFSSLVLLFVVWANCHGSFAVGLTLIALDVGGRSLDVWWRSGRPAAVLRSDALRSRWLLLTACTLAGCLNPFGPEIYREVLRVGRHPNIASMYEWAPLTLAMRQGRATAVVVAVWCVLLWLTPARRRWRELLPVLFFGMLSLWSSRMLNWLAPVVAVSLGRHLAAVQTRRWRRIPGAAVLRVLNQPSAFWSGANAVLLLALFSQTSLAGRCLGRADVSPAAALARITPVAVTQFLSEAVLPDGSALIPAEWAGFVMYNLDGRVQSFINLHVHVIPEAVWQEYLLLLRGPEDLAERLRHRSIHLVVVDVRRHGRLRQRMMKTAGFRIIYEDSQATVFCRQSAAAVDPPSG